MERNKKGQNSENTENHARHIRFDSIAAAESKWTLIKINGNSRVAYFVSSALFCAILEEIQEGSYQTGCRSLVLSIRHSGVRFQVYQVYKKFAKGKKHQTKNFRFLLHSILFLNFRRFFYT